MLGKTWLTYFEANDREDRAPARSLPGEVPRSLHGPISASLARFQLGESAGGRIHEEIATHRDPVLDPEMRRSVQLYIEEEWRHSRELAVIIGSLGGRLLRSHWTNAAFTACRRVLGLRTKMMTLAIAEVVGIVYYRTVAAGSQSPELAQSLRLIAAEESRHLDFQAAFFAQAVSLWPSRSRGAYRFALHGLLLAVFVAALVVLWLDHGKLLKAMGARFRSLGREAWHELSSRRFLHASGRGSSLARPSLAGARKLR